MDLANLDTLVMDLAFAIEDPCGEDEIRLARAAIELVRRVEAKNRKHVAIILDDLGKVAERLRDDDCGRLILTTDPKDAA
jgi:hypothetical protein